MELTPFFFGPYKFVKYGLYQLTWVVLRERNWDQASARTCLDYPGELSQPSATRRSRVHKTGLSRHTSPLRIRLAEPTERRLGQHRPV